MKKKSNASTDSVAATSDGPRPKRAAAIDDGQQVQQHQVRLAQVAAGERADRRRRRHQAQRRRVARDARRGRRRGRGLRECPSRSGAGCGMGRERRGRSAGAQSCSSAAGAQAPGALGTQRGQRAERVDAAGANARQPVRAPGGGHDRERRHGPAGRGERAQRPGEPARPRGQQPQRQTQHREHRDQQVAHGPGALARGVREQNRVQPRAAAEADRPGA